MSYLLVGNYGVGNVGDEALKEYFLRAFDDIEWVVVGVDVPRLPGGIRSFIKFDWFKTIDALKKSDGVVFGGGSLFTDVESSYACFLWWVHAFWGRLFGKKIILAFQGVGPHKTFFGKMFSRWVVRRATFVSVRDHESFERVKQWRRRGDVIESFDPVFSLVKAKEYDLSSQKNLVVIPRRNSGELLKKSMVELLKTDRWDHIIFLSLQPDDVRERKVCMTLRKEIDQQVEMVSVRSVTELVDGVSRGSFILSERYHGALVAMALGRELQIIEQGKDDKLASIQQIIDDIPLHGRKEHLTKLVEDGEKELQKILICS